MGQTNSVQNPLHSNLLCTNGNYVNLCKENIIETIKVVEKGKHYLLFNLYFFLILVCNN